MMKRIVSVIVLLIVAFYSYEYFQPNHNLKHNASVNALSTLSLDDVDNIAPTYVDNESAQPVAASFFCDGRQHCSQMTSCAEATYFIRHCPNTQMDGNQDGVPCEQQWCH